MSLPDSIVLVSRARDGSPLSGDAGGLSLDIDNSGTRVLFETSALDKVFINDAYVKDLQTGDLTPVNGQVDDSTSENVAVLSDDGRVAAYNSGNRVLYRRPLDGDKESVTFDADGNKVTNSEGFGAIPFSTDIDTDADGDAFVYNANFDTSDDASGGSSPAREFYHYDLTSGTVTRLDTASGNAPVTDVFEASPDLSGDGRYVVFRSDSDELSPQDSNGFSETIEFGGQGFASTVPTADVYRKDTQTGETMLVSLADDETQFSKGSFRPAVSTNGRYVAWESNEGSANTTIYWRDVDAGTTRVASADPNGRPAVGNLDGTPPPRNIGDSVSPEISGDGQFVVFWSESGLLTNDDVPEAFDLFVKDMNSGAIARIGHDAVPEEGRTAQHGKVSISENGRWIAFSSSADGLVAGDDDGEQDVFRVKNPLRDPESAREILDDFEAAEAVPNEEIPGVFDLPDVPFNPEDLFNFESGRVIVAGREIDLPVGDPQWFEDMEARIDEAIIADPEIATGYDYRLSNPGDGMGFRTVELPSIGGDSSYDLTVYNGGGNVIGNQTVAARTEFDLTQFGETVTHFAVGGIDPEAELDPSDARAFPTSLTFTRNGTVDLQQTPLIRGFEFDFDTAADRKAAIAAVYTGYYNRAADPEGLDFWTGELTANDKGDFNKTLLGIASGFGQVPESKSEYDLFAKLDNDETPTNADREAFVTAIYQNLFDRAPEEAGLDYWTGQLAAGQEPGLAIVNIISGARGGDTVIVGNKIEAAQYYAETFEANETRAWDADVDRADAVTAIETVGGTDASLANGRSTIDDFFA